MKSKIAIVLSSILVAISLVTLGVTEIQAAETNNKVVYFHSETCESCNNLKGIDVQSGNYTEEDDYIKKMTDAGIEIIYMDVDTVGPATTIPENVTIEGDEDPTVNDIWTAFSDAYNGPDNNHTPHMFVGEKQYYDEEIKEAWDNGEFQLEAQKDLLPVTATASQNFNELRGFLGFLAVLGAGLLDGFNPCAIALLLLFISLVGFTENKKVLIIVSVTYIATMFLSYFFIGLGLLSALEAFAKTSGLATIVSWIIFILVLIFFIFNMYDFFVSKNEDYGKIKNQLPKWVQKMNKRIMKTFTNVMNDEGGKGNLFGVIALTFVLGLTMSLTEFLCTGQIYLGILDGVRYFQSFYAYFALFAYNVMFVSPMIVIAVIAVKSGSIMSTSNWIREHLHIIKLLNALLFLGIAIYYGFRLFG